MSDQTGATLRTLLSTAAREGPGRGYPRDLRDRAARHALTRREQGATYDQLAHLLGVPARILQRWARLLRRGPTSITTSPSVA